MTKFDRLLARLEEQAVTIDRLTREQRSEREAAQHGLRSARQQIADLHLENAKLHEPPHHNYARVCKDIASLLDRDNLSDAEKVQSINGLLDQVMERKPKAPAWLVAAREAESAEAAGQDEPQTDAAEESSDVLAAGQASPSPKPARRTTKARG